MSGRSGALASVKAEVHRLASSMRTNQRWSTYERFKRELPIEHESPLLRSLKELYNELSTVDDLYALDCVAYTAPFLDVIVSEETSGIITGVALAAINKFLLYDFINADAPRSAEAVNRIAHASTHCRFEPVSTSDDEAVLSKLLEVVGNTLRCGAGPALTDDAVWSLAQVAFLVSRIDKASYLLTRAAESTLGAVVMHVFARAAEFAGTQDTAAGGRHTASVRRGDGVATTLFNDAGEDASVRGGEGTAPPPSPNAPARLLLPRAGLDAGSSPASLVASFKRGLPYGAPVLQRLLSWLASLTDPRGHGRGTRVLGLELTNIVLETGGSALGDLPGVVSVVQAEVCKHLISNSRSSDLAVLSLALRVVFNLFSGLKQNLKVQLEVFLTSVHLYLADSRTAAPEQRELALESLVEFTREPNMMLDLYANFDCDLACTNLFEATVRCVCRNAVPEPRAALTSLHAIALEGVLAILHAMARRCPGHPAYSRAASGEGEGAGGARIQPLDSLAAEGGEGEGLHPYALVQEGEAGVSGGALGAMSTTAAHLRQRRQLKRKLGLAAERFRTDPKHWVAYTQELGLLPAEATPEGVAAFLRGTPGIDRTALGLYISEPDDGKHAFNTAVRKAYVGGFSFGGMRVDTGLRVFLESFRLPGEAQKIERLMQSFSERLFEQSPGPMAHPDTAFVLAYSIIMLNTDLHNKQVRKKMTKAQFLSNNRGIDAGKDLPAEYLGAIFDSIAAKEIHLRADVSMMRGGTPAPGGAGGAGGGEGGGDGGHASSTTTSRSHHRDDNDGEEDTPIAALGTQWDGILSRQSTVTAYTSSSAVPQQGFVTVPSSLGGTAWTGR